MRTDLRRGDIVQCLFHNVVVLNVDAPIALRRLDKLLVEIRTGRIEAVERFGVVVWRWSWKN